MVLRCFLCTQTKATQSNENAMFCVQECYHKTMWCHVLRKYPDVPPMFWHHPTWQCVTPSLNIPFQVYCKEQWHPKVPPLLGLCHGGRGGHSHTSHTEILGPKFGLMFHQNVLFNRFKTFGINFSLIFDPIDPFFIDFKSFWLLIFTNP